MIQRVFEYAEVPCTGVLEHPEAGESRLKVEKISRNKAILLTTLSFPRYQGVALTLELPHETPLSVALKASVIESRDGRLFVRWEHEDAKAEARFHSLLVETSLRKHPPEKSPAEEKPAKARRSSKRDRAAVASILKRAKTMRSADLAARVDSVRVLSTRNITRLIQQAVNDALEKSAHAFSEEEKARLLEEAEGEFKERLEVVQAEKAGIEAHSRKLQEQLELAQKVLEEERLREVRADQFTVSADGMAVLEQRLGRLIDRVSQAGSVSTETEAEMREVVARLLDDEREKISQKAREAQSDAISLLERKVQRLAGELDDAQTRRELAERRAQVLEQSGGALHNIMAAGLDLQDPDRERKLQLLEELVKDNRDVRGHMGQPTTPVAPAKAEARKPTPVKEKPAAEVRNVETDPSVEEELVLLFGAEEPPPDGGLDDGAGTESAAGTQTTSAVKKIEVCRKAPPPLERA